MSSIPRVLSTPVDHVPFRSTRFVLRLTLCLLVTAMNASVIVYAAPILFRVSAHHLAWLAGVSLLFGSLLVSLLRVWLTALSRAVR